MHSLSHISNPPSRFLLILLLFSLARFFPFPPFIPRRARILARFLFAFYADFLAAASTGIWLSFCILSFVAIKVEEFVKFVIVNGCEIVAEEIARGIGLGCI